MEEDKGADEKAEPAADAGRRQSTGSSTIEVETVPDEVQDEMAARETVQATEQAQEENKAAEESAQGETTQEETTQGEPAHETIEVDAKDHQPNDAAKDEPMPAAAETARWSPGAPARGAPVDAASPSPPPAAPTLPLPPSLGHLSDSYPPSSVLYIANLRRPLLLSALHEHLAPTTLPASTAMPFAHADFPGLWLSGVKDHAYAGYDSAETALAVAERVHGITWPEGTGLPLEVQFVDPAEVKRLTRAEEGAWNKRQRLVLEVTRSERGWEFDVVPPVSERRGSRPGGLANPNAAAAGEAGRVSLADRLTAPSVTAPADGQERGSLAGRLSPLKEGRGLADSLTGPARTAREEAAAGPLARPEPQSDERLGPIKRTRTEPVLAYREGPGATTTKRQRRGGRDGGRGRRGGGGRGDSWRPGDQGGGGGGGGGWGRAGGGGGGGGGGFGGGGWGRAGGGGGWGDRGGGGGWGGGRGGDRYVPPDSGRDERDSRGGRDGWGRRDDRFGGGGGGGGGGRWGRGGRW